VASLVHRLECSESLSGGSAMGLLEAYASVVDTFNQDPTAVYVQQFFRSSLSGMIQSRVVWERSPLHSSFRRSRKWICLDPVVSVPVNGTKRRADDDGDRVFKRIRTSSGVSSSFLCYFVVDA
jgi:hypothetical protein